MSELDDLANAASRGPTVRRHVPGYPAILSGASLINFFGWIAITFGAAFLAFGIIAGIGAVQSFNPEGSHRDKLVAFMSVFIYPFMMGVWMSVCAAILRMTAALAIAIRDIAMNSFRR